MKKIHYFIFLFACIMATFSCKTQQYTPLDYPKEQIRFGNGGGFAGSVIEYVLLENGELFSKSGLQGEFAPMKKVEKQLTKQLFNNVELLGLKNLQHNEPGNRYYFVTLKNQTTEHQIVWNSAENIPSKIKSLFGILNYLANEQKGEAIPFKQ